MNQAFILGAGIGTRLRPLTHRLPKPLVPVFHRPMAGYAFDACAALGISRFAVNTHHLAEAWRSFTSPAGTTLDFFHEADLLDTGGGLKNVEGWAGGRPLLVHNGDILTTMPLDRLMRAHEASGLPVTLAARRVGPPPHLALDAAGGRVADIRGLLGGTAGTHGFAGVYCVNPEFFARLPGGGKVSVIPAFLDGIRRGELGVVVIEEGDWLDLGDRDSYLRAHRELALGPAIHPEARVHPDARLEHTIVGPGAVIGAAARLVDCVVWPGAEVAAGSDLERCVVATRASGCHRDADLV